MANKKTRSKKRRGKKDIKNFMPIISGVAIIILAVILIQAFSSPSAAAIVNGDKITLKQVDEYYDRIPEQLKMLVTKDQVLDQLINEKVLLQEAAKHDIAVTDEEVNILISKAIDQSGMTEEEFNQRLKDQDITMGEMVGYYKEQMTITKLLNQTILSETNTSDQETLSQATQLYLSQLKSNSDIKILMESESEEETLTNLEMTETTSNAIADCLSDYNISSSTVVFIHSNYCPHCKAMMPIVKELEDEGYIFYWAESSDQEAQIIVDACLSEVMSGYVPQFICPSTGAEKTGEMSKSTLKAFADNC